MTLGACSFSLCCLNVAEQSMLRSHENSKMKSNLYMRTKPSVISEEQHLAGVAAPKQVNYMIDNKIRKEKSPSSSPRDRQQIYWKGTYP